MAAKTMPQRCVQQMRCAMVGAKGITAFGIDFQRYKIANFNLASANGHLVGMQTSQRFGRVSNFANQFGAGNHPSITHLTTALPIKWRLVRDYRHGVIFNCRLYFNTVIDERNDLPLALAGGVASKFRRTDTLHDVEPHIVRCLCP